MLPWARGSRPHTAQPLGGTSAVPATFIWSMGASTTAPTDRAAVHRRSRRVQWVASGGKLAELQLECGKRSAFAGNVTDPRYGRGATERRGAAVSDVAANLARLNEARDNPTLSLLNMKWAPVILAIFAEAFGDDHRPIRTEVFHAQVAVLLDELREVGYETPEGEPRDLCRNWVNSRWLRRLPVDADGGEVYELTSYTLEAQRTINNLAREQVLLSDSRLTTILNEARGLALSASPDREHRVRVLQEEIDRLQAQLDGVLNGGELAAASDDEMLNGFLNLSDLLGQLPGDFQRVTEGIRRIHLEMVQAFRGADLSKGEVLDSYIDESEQLTARTREGRAFESALIILNDHQQMDEFRSNLRLILEHPFAESLRADERWEFLDANAMLSRGLDAVVGERRKASRSLRDHLASRDSAQDRHLGQLLVRIQDELRIWMQDARPRDVVTFDQMPSRLDLDRVLTRFYDPANERPAPELEDVSSMAPAAMSLGEVRRWGGPLSGLVRTSVADLLEAGAAGTVGEAFNQLPEDLRRPVEVFALMQILTNIAGIWDLRRGDDAELVTAIRPDGTTRTMPIPRLPVTSDQIRPERQEEH